MTKRSPFTRCFPIAFVVMSALLLGTFGILAAAGFSINTLTMFGMVLAIGLLVRIRNSTGPSSAARFFNRRFNSGSFVC